MQNATRTLAPIPMDDRLLHLALELKTAGLQWEPEVGYFVWDPQGLISHPSPFPKRIYFILSMKRFLKVFGDLEKMKRHLVWLPTWYQVRQVMRRLEIGPGERDPGRSFSQPSTPEEEMIRLYRCILKHLKSHEATASGGRPTEHNGAREEWIRAVMASDLGNVNQLPKPVQDRIEDVYSEISRAYLGWRRLQEGQAEDWLPQETVFDSELLSDLGHFFSDYQASIKSLNRIRKAIQLLGAINQQDDREDYDRLVALILERDSKVKGSCYASQQLPILRERQPPERIR